MTSIYFGRPGAQITLPDPRGGVQGSRDRPTSTFRTGTGGARSSRLLDGKRQYTLNWQQLWYQTYASIEGYHHGHEGPGPFVLHDPGRINQLTVNQSGATSLRNDTDGFSVSASGHTLASSASTVHRGPRCLEWNTAYAVSGQMTLDTPTPTWPGIPCVAGLALEFAFQVIGNGATDPTVNINAQLIWLDSTGAVLSTTTGATVATTGASWQQATATATPPAGAYYVRPAVKLSGNLAGASVHLDEFQMEWGSSPSTWRPGTGVYPVQVVSLTEQWPWSASDHRQNATLVLQEVGP